MARCHRRWIGTHHCPEWRLGTREVYVKNSISFKTTVNCCLRIFRYPNWRRSLEYSPPRMPGAGDGQIGTDYFKWVPYSSGTYSSDLSKPNCLYEDMPSDVRIHCSKWNHLICPDTRNLLNSYTRRTHSIFVIWRDSPNSQREWFPTVSTALGRCNYHTLMPETIYITSHQVRTT